MKFFETKKVASELLTSLKIFFAAIILSLLAYIPPAFGSVSTEAFINNNLKPGGLLECPTPYSVQYCESVKPWKKFNWAWPNRCHMLDSNWFHLNDYSPLSKGRNICGERSVSNNADLSSDGSI